MPHSHTHCFNGHFSGEPRLDGFLIDVLDLCDLQVRQTDTRLTVSFQDNLVSWHQKGYTTLNFYEARDDGVAVALVGPCANHLHLAADR